MLGRVPAATFGRMPDQSPPDAFLSALSMRDFGRLAECLAPSAQARMLLPRGLEVRAGRDAIARSLQRWFAQASEFEVLDTGSQRVGTRTRLHWRFRLMRDGEACEVIEQLAFIDVAAEGISIIDMLCSGFLRKAEPDASSTFDADSMGCADGLAQEFRRNSRMWVSGSHSRSSSAILPPGRIFHRSQECSGSQSSQSRCKRISGWQSPWRSANE